MDSPRPWIRQAAGCPSPISGSASPAQTPTVRSRRCCSSLREISPASLTRNEHERTSEMTAANIKQAKPLPPPDSDFYRLAETFPPEALALGKTVGAVLATKVAPINTKKWVAEAFPF